MKPSPTDGRIETGNRLLDEDRFDEADACFQAAARGRPSDPEPLAGLVRVGRRRNDIQELRARLERYLQLRPNALEERANWLQIIANRGELARARHELPALLDRADRETIDRPVGRRLLRLIQSCLVGSERTLALIRMRDRVEASVANSLGPDDKDGPANTWRNEADNLHAKGAPNRFWLRKLFLAEMELALGNYDVFSASVLSLHDPNSVDELHSDIKRVRDKIVSDSFPDFGRGKVFGIGLSRTGTTSLNTALNQLGFHSIHWTSPLTMDVISRDDFVLFDAFTDISVSHQFEWLYYTFPKSKFIFTHRDAESWVRSVTLHYQNNDGHGDIRKVCQSPARHRFLGKAALIHENLYGGVDNWRDAHTRYNDRVHAFFRDKPKERFLEMSIAGGDGYEKLCPFLGAPIPDGPFPNTNAHSERAMVTKLRSPELA